jgi:hypothetical protein
VGEERFGLVSAKRCARVPAKEQGSLIMSSTLPKLALRRETVRNLGVKSSVRAGSLVGSFSNNASLVDQNSTNPVPKSSGSVGPHSSDTGGGGGSLGWFPH